MTMIVSKASAITIGLLVLSSQCLISKCFVTPSYRHPSTFDRTTTASTRPWTATRQPRRHSSSFRIPTERNVWWFGGTEDVERQAEEDGDSCELVAVRIERPTPNSRRIFGEITAPVPLRDVWAILTDYDRLSIHVPNLVESKIVSRPRSGEPGDGTYKCRLFQKGAQKIVGFEFGASVTMEMGEVIHADDSSSSVVATTPAETAATATGAVPTTVAVRNGRSVIQRTRSAAEAPSAVATATRSATAGTTGLTPGNERSVTFKCVDSFFFSGFDGEWNVQERVGDNGEPETLLKYSVEVRPKGPVPVAALEWRIREDVPTNLRAVKRAACSVGYEGVMAKRRPPARARSLARGASSQLQQSQSRQPTSFNIPSVPAAAASQVGRGRRRVDSVVEAATKRGQAVLKKQQLKWERDELNIPATASGRIRASARRGQRALAKLNTWDRDETMAAYLTDS